MSAMAIANNLLGIGNNNGSEVSISPVNPNIIPEEVLVFSRPPEEITTQIVHNQRRNCGERIRRNIPGFALWPFHPRVNIINSQRGDDVLIQVKGTILTLRQDDDSVHYLSIVIHVKHEHIPLNLLDITRVMLPFRVLFCAEVMGWDVEVQFQSVKLLIIVAAMLHGQVVDGLVGERCQLLVKRAQGDKTYKVREILTMDLTGKTNEVTRDI